VNETLNTQLGADIEDQGPQSLHCAISRHDRCLHCLHPARSGLAPTIGPERVEGGRAPSSRSALVAHFHSTRDVAERGHKEPQLNGLTVPDTPTTIAPGPSSAVSRYTIIYRPLGGELRVHRIHPPSRAAVAIASRHCPSPPLPASCQPTSTVQPSVSGSPPTIRIHSSAQHWTS
jgi:hypothetical protein